PTQPIVMVRDPWQRWGRRQLPDKWTGKAGHESNEFSLTRCGRLAEEPMQMRLDGRLTNAERIGCLRHAGQLDDREQDAQLARCQLECAGNPLNRRFGTERRLLYQDSGDSSVAVGSAATTCRCERQYMCDVALTIAGRQWHGDGLNLQGAITALGPLKNITQDARCISVGRNELTVRRTQHGALGQYGLPSGVGMNDTGAR